MNTEQLARFQHHPNAAIDFCAEVDALEGLVYEAAIGNRPRAPVIDRIYSALDFAVGGDANAVAAKDTLRRLAEQTGQW